MRTLIFMNRFDLDSLQLTEKIKEERSEVEVILIQDAVYMVLKGSDQSERIKSIMAKGIKFHILKGDVERRGTVNHLLTDVKLMDYDQLIDLLFNEGQMVINI